MKRNRLMAAAIVAAFGAATTLPALAADSAAKAEKQQQGAQSKPGKQGNAATGGTDKQAKQPAGKDAPLIVLVPVAVASTDSFADGCWARLYDGQNFQGDQLSLVGPADMPNMRTAFGTDWGGEFDSIQVGPKATVTVYDAENYRERAATFKPGQRVADMGEKMGLFEDVRSLKIACAGGGRTAQKDGGSAAASGSSAGASKK